MNSEKPSFASVVTSARVARQVRRRLRRSPGNEVVPLLELRASGACALAMVGAGPAVTASLLPKERAALGAVGSHRQREFALGRCCAREAMRRIGMTPSPIGREPGGAPRWPESVVGSISHTHGYAVAVLARGVGAVGVDVERTDRELTERAWTRVLAGTRVGQRRQDRHAVFAIKEAFYKLVFPSVGRLVGFDAVRVTLFGEGLGCSVQLNAALSPNLGTRVRWFGNYLYWNHLVLAWMCATDE